MGYRSFLRGLVVDYPKKKRDAEVAKLAAVEPGTEVMVYCSVFKQGRGNGDQAAVISKYREAGWEVVDQSLGKSFGSQPYVNIRFRKKAAPVSQAREIQNLESAAWQRSRSLRPAGPQTRPGPDL